MLRAIILLTLGVVACASAATMLKACTVPAELTSAVRMLVASLVLLPAFLLARRRHGALHFTAGHARRTWLPAFALAIHMMLWAYGAHITLTAQATLIVNLVPVALPFFLFFMMREKINRGEIIATLLTLVGLVLLVGKDAISGTGNVLGNLACLVSMFFLTWYLALARKNRDFISIWLYLVPVYFRAGLICLLVSTPRLIQIQEISPENWMLLFLLAIIPTVFGHSLINFSMRNLRGQLVSLANCSQFIFAGIMAWLFFSEMPPPVFYVAALLVVCGIVLAIRNTPAVAIVPHE